MDYLTIEQVQFLIADAVSKISPIQRPFKVFGLNATHDYANNVAKHLDIPLAIHTEKNFDDGECFVKSGPEYSDSSSGNVRGHNVFVIQSLYSDNNESVADKFLKLCTFCGSLKDASAYEVIAVVPYLAFCRQDRKITSRSPITTKYIANMLEAVGVNRALFMDLHNLAVEQNCFEIPIDNLEAKNLIADWCAQKLIFENKTKKIRVLSPDSGGLGRCERFRVALLKKLNERGTKLDDIEIVVFDKLRIKGEVRGGRIIGDVENADVIAYDDMISTGGTMKKACDAVAGQKGRMFAICATHGLFCGNANEVFDKIDAHIVITDTVVPFRLDADNQKKVHVIGTNKMIADAILRINSGNGSISQLLG